MGSYAVYCDERGAENPFGTDSSPDRLIHLPSLAVQQRSQSPSEYDLEQGSNVTLPPLRVIIPHQFTTSSGTHGSLIDTHSSRVSNLQKISPDSQTGQKRMKLNSLISPPSSSSMVERIRSSPGRQDYVEQDSSRRSRRERSLSELPRMPPACPPISSTVANASDYRSRYCSPSQQDSFISAQASYDNRQVQTLPPLSAFSRGTPSIPGPERENFRQAARSGTFETANGTVTTIVSSNRVDPRWSRRSNSNDYLFHGRSHGFGTMVPGGAEFAEAAPPPYSWDMSESAENQMNRKRRGNLPKAATSMFKKWFDEHRDSPYPTEEEKARFCRETGLTMNQVGNWFINARRRQPNRGLRDGPGSFRDDL